MRNSPFRSGYSPARSPKPMTPEEFAAFERFSDGRALGTDYEIIAKIFRRLGVLPLKTQRLSNAAIGRMMQKIDYRISEGLDRIILPNGEELQ